MGTFEDAVNKIRAAFEPGADAATKAEAAATLRAVLAVLDASPGGAAVLPAASATPGEDILGAILEKIRRLAPDGAKLDVPRLSIPLVSLPKP
ncbi:MAG: hypothetical protein HY698_07655 [Deltaproteobacteria bacterium]|nr:hypothetical protein [Deltaproteobacteria bacterium]